MTNPWLWFLAISFGLLNACRYGFLDWGLAHLIETQGGAIGKSALTVPVDEAYQKLRNEAAAAALL